MDVPLVVFWLVTGVQLIASPRKIPTENWRCAGFAGDYNRTLKEM
jgi:hypothetical protein